VGITTFLSIFHGLYSSCVKGISLLAKMVQGNIGGEHTKPQNVNIHGKCGMKIVYDRSLKRKWPRLLKGWKIFWDKGNF